MKTLHLLFSHHLTELQKKDAYDNLGISEIKYLPEHLQAVWSNVPPTPDLQVKEHLKPILEYLANTAQNQDVVLVQGDFGATYETVTFCKNIGLTPVYATTERKSVEKQNPDGTITTQRIFQHIHFRKY